MSLVDGSTRSNNADFYGRALGHVLRSQRLYDPSYALSRDPDAYDRLRRDAVIAFALRYRKLLSAGRDWYLEAASSAAEDRLLLKILEDLLKQIQHFDTARFNLSEAIIAGSRWAHIEGKLVTLRSGSLPAQEWWVVERLSDVDKRRFRLYPVDAPPTREEVLTQGSGGTLVPSVRHSVNRKFEWQIWRPLQQQWERIQREEYVRHVYDDREDTLGYGGGLADELYTYWFAKEVALQHGLQYLERWSQGMIVALVDTLRDGKASLPLSSARMTEWLNVLEKMRSRHILVADAKDRVEIKDAPTGGWQAAMDTIRYLDGAMRVAILGSELPTSSDTKGGSFALAEVQQDTTEALSRYDQVGIEETIRRDVLGWLVAKNRPQLQALGLDGCTLPYLRLREGRRDNAQIRADVLLKARQAKLDIRRDEAYAQLGFSPPAPGDEILPELAQNAPMNLGSPSALAGPEAREAQREATEGTRLQREAAKGPGEQVQRGFAVERVREGDDLLEFGRPSNLDSFMARAVMGGVRKFLLPEPPVVNVHVPQQPPPNITVNVPAQVPPTVEVRVPEQPTPQVTVNVPTQEAPVVNVSVPTPSVSVAAPDVRMTLPELKPEIKVELPKISLKKRIEVIRDRQGFITGAEIVAHE